MKTTLTIQQIIDEWLANSDVLPITKISYRNKTNLWFRYLLSVKADVRSARRSHVLDYKHHLEEGGYSQLTVDAYITAVKLFYAYCESARYCENIAGGIRCAVRYKGHRKSTLTIDQGNALLGSTDTETVIGKRDKLIMALMLFNGLRTCEVQRIDICDFDIQDGVHVLTIQRKGRREKAEMISVCPEIMEMFEDYTSCRDFNVTDPLFVSVRTGERLTRTKVARIVKDHLRGIGIDSPDITAHSLRHTFASTLINEGVDIETVRDSMGHSSTTTTRIYVAEAQQRKLIKNSPSRYVINAFRKAESITKEQTDGRGR